jgi:hypothetical protein
VAGEEEEKHGTGGQWSQSGPPGSGADEGTASVGENDINAVRGWVHVLGMGRGNSELGTKERRTETATWAEEDR